MSTVNPIAPSGQLRRFRVLAINGGHIAIAGDYASWQEAVDARREWADNLDRDDQTWFDIVPLLEKA